MTAKPLVLLDPWPRRSEMIFTPAQRERLNALADIVAHEGERMPAAMVERHLPDAVAILGQTDLAMERLAQAAKLRAVINVEGNFLQNVDYEACFCRGIHVLAIAPAFALPVAEAALGFALDLARGITAADRAFRAGEEQYGLAGNRDSFLLTGATVGLIGFGNLGLALRPLLAPFRCQVMVHDPWLPDGYIRDHGCEPVALDALLAGARVIFVLAGVTAQNAGFLDRAALERIRPGSVVVLASRAAVVDFDALIDLAAAGRLRVATDVFPEEPVPPGHRVRGAPGMLLSAHRAGGIPAAFARIGEMVVDDLALILRGLPPVRLQPARRETVATMRSTPGRTYPQGIRA